MPGAGRRRSWPLALGLAAALALACATAPAASARPASVLVKVRGGAVASEATRVAARHGLRVLRTLPRIGWAELGLRRGDQARQRRALARDPRVARIDFSPPGTSVRLALQPRDPLDTDGIETAGGVPVNYHWAHAQFYGAWDRSQGLRGGSPIVVADIDSEFDTAHPDLAGKLLPGWNTSSGTPDYHTSRVRANVAGDTFVDDLHGSHTAGLIGAATDNQVGVSGACFRCSVLPIKVILRTNGDASTDAKLMADISEAVIWAADHGASAINMSFGTPRYSQPLQDAINYAHARGVVLVAASGNDQQAPDANRPHYPAAMQHVIAVGATGPDDVIAPFSSAGDWVDVSAPGVSILSTIDMRSADALRVDGQVFPGYGFASGTSMATPIVTGLVGLMRAARPDLTPDEVEALLESTARDLGARGKDPLYGFGLVNADAAVAAAIAYLRPVAQRPPSASRPGPGPAPSAVRTRARATLAITGPKALRAGGRLALAGWIRPRAKGVLVLLQRRNGRRWTTVARTRTAKAGGYRFKLPARVGSQRYRTLTAGGAVRPATTSRTLVVRVLAPRRR